jgi:ATP-dependent protease ClpP protease subunit
MITDLSEIEQDLHSQGVCHMWGEVTTELAAQVSKFILWHNLKQFKHVKHLMLIINSEGGELTHAFALSDLITHSKIPVHMLGVGQISSAGLMVFMSGCKGHRMITHKTHIMSHQWSTHVQGKTHELLSAHEDMQITQRRVISHYETHTKTEARTNFTTAAAST